MLCQDFSLESSQTTWTELQESGDGAGYSSVDPSSIQVELETDTLQILEGIASVLAAIVVFFILPDFPASTTSKFLTEEERILACNRLAVEGISLTQGAHEKVGEWKAFKMVCADWRTWALCLLFALGTGSQTIQYFIPSLVKSFGWEGNTAQCKFANAAIFGRNHPNIVSSNRLHHSELCLRSSLHPLRLLPRGPHQINLARPRRSFRFRIHLLRSNHTRLRWYDAICSRNLRLRTHLRLFTAGQDLDFTYSRPSS